jgi:hypothetical protein
MPPAIAGDEVMKLPVEKIHRVWFVVGDVDV